MPIYDLSYRRITGTRSAQGMRFLPIAAMGIRHFFKKKLNLILLLFTLAPYVVGAFVLLIPLISSDMDAIGDTFRRFLHVTGDAAFLALMTVSYFLVVVLGLASGAGAVANDMTSNALEIYFSRPITRLDYVLGKLGAVVGIMALGSLAPMLLLCVLDIAVASEEGYLADQIPVILRIVAAHAVVLTVIGLVVLAVSSLVKSQRNATVMFAAIMFGTLAFSKILVEVTRNRDWLLIDFKEPLDRVAYELLDVASANAPEVDDAAKSDRNMRRLQMMSARLRGGYTTSPQPLKGTPTAHCVFVVLGWYGVAIFVLWRRVRGFEVVKG